MKNILGFLKSLRKNWRLFCTFLHRVGGTVHVWKRLACFPHCNGNGSWVICVLLACSRLFPDMFLSWPNPVLSHWCFNVFSLKTLLVLFVHVSGEWLYVIMAGRGSIDILKWERLEILGDPFLFLAKLCLLLASVFVNGNIRFAAWQRNWGHLPAQAEAGVMPLVQCHFFSVGASGVWVSDVSRTGLMKNLHNNTKTGLSQ